MERERLNKDQYYINLASDLYLRSTCLRRKFGALIVKNDEIISTGYNGAPRKTKSSLDHGWCWREEHNIPHGKNYELCRSVHAEMNAIISPARKDMLGGTIYIAGENADGTRCISFPCVVCIRLIINAGLERLVYKAEDNSLKEEFPQKNWKDDEFMVVGKYK